MKMEAMGTRPKYVAKLGIYVLVGDIVKLRLIVSTSFLLKPMSPTKVVLNCPCKSQLSQEVNLWSTLVFCMSTSYYQCIVL